MSDTTIIYYTANTLREPFFSRAKQQLLEASNGLPIISVSQKPMDFGENILYSGDRSVLSIYKQILIGTKAAETRYVAMAEDDVLYPKEHFYFIPPERTFCYDMAKWSIYTWTKPPMYSLKNRKTMTTMICERDYLIEALEERFNKYPDESQINIHYFAEPGRYERKLRVTVRDTGEFVSQVPCIVFSHPDALGYEIQGDKKRMGYIKAYDIPIWGKAEDVMKRFYETI